MTHRDRDKIKKVFRMLRKEGFPVLFTACCYNTEVDYKKSLLWLKGHPKHCFNDDGSIKGDVFYAWDAWSKEGIKCAQLFVVGLMEEGIEVINPILNPTKAIGIRTKGAK